MDKSHRTPKARVKIITLLGFYHDGTNWISNKELKCNNLSGIDIMNGELEKIIKEVLFNIITNAYETNEVPEDFEKCIMTPISKEKWEAYRIICLMCPMRWRF